MTENIRTVISPLLIISYVCGLRIIEFPIGHPRIWFSLLYMLLLWSTYFFLLKFAKIFYFNYTYNIAFFLCIGSDILVTLLSIMFGFYHDEKLKKCLRKLDIIDNTLLNIGTRTDYQKLHKKIIYLILGLLVLIASMTYATAYWMKHEFNCDILTCLYVLLIRKYCSYINIINDVIITSIFGYIGLKFDQINQLLLDLVRNNKREIKQAWGKSMQQHAKFSQASIKEWMIWIIIHLHSELRKISREVDTIFGAQMTFKMGCNFCWLAFDLRELFRVILANNFTKYDKILFIAVLLIWLFHNFLKLFFINYICETVSTKANATGNIINKLPYSTCDIAVRENMLQLLLQITQAPVRFYGIGLFQCGYKFFYGFSASITTVVVLLVQAYMYD